MKRRHARAAAKGATGVTGGEGESEGHVGGALRGGEGLTRADGAAAGDGCGRQAQPGNSGETQSFVNGAIDSTCARGGGTMQ